MRRSLTTLATALLMTGLASPAALAGGATQISGTGAAIECDAMPAEYVIPITGDLEGCLYGTALSARLSEGGTYLERDHEVFVGTYQGESGTFEVDAVYTAKFAGEVFASPQHFGRCQHPIITGTGTGVFDGVSGRLDFKDDVEQGTYEYRGHLRFDG